MSAQIQQSFFDVNLFAIEGAKKQLKKRIRYKIPTYKKKYRLSWQDEETKEWFYDSDEKHIFRIRDLQKIHSLIYGYCGINLFEQAESVEKFGLVCWVEDKQAEIKDTWRLSIKDRIKIHLKLLRLLRQGKDLEEAVRIARKTA